MMTGRDQSVKPVSGGLLPGGLVVDGLLVRHYQFKPVTGEIEQFILESGETASNLVQQVTDILVVSLESVAGLPVSRDVVCRLSSGDREYLILQLQSLLHPGSQWLTKPCQYCHEPVQFQLYPSSLPSKQAGQGFPETDINLSIGNFRLRVVNGSDEEWIAEHRSDNTERLLLQRLLNLKNMVVDQLSELDEQKIDRVLDEMSPQITQVVSISCPYCQQQQNIPLDHYDWIIQHGQELDKEIHAIASHYHWSEKEILSLSKSRRHRYIDLIDRYSSASKESMNSPHAMGQKNTFGGL